MAQPSHLQLAYWEDRFVILEAVPMKTRVQGCAIWRLRLNCRGRQTLAYVHEQRLPAGFRPRPGCQILASLRISRQASNARLHVQHLQCL